MMINLGIVKFFLKINQAVFKFTVKFIGEDKMTYKNGNESSRTHANQILLSRSRLQQSQSSFAHSF